jgi:hypothetical protein
VGALIAFEQDANLDEFVGAHKGHEVDARVSSELLVSLFLPDATNKLHDGAVIIRNLRVAKAGVFFPMPESRVIDASFGSRHRAALGITEETDAVVVIVSEERGSISLCFNGNIAADLPVTKLKESLESIFNPKVVKKSRKAQKMRQTEAPPQLAETPKKEEARISLRSSEVDVARPQRSSEGEATRSGSTPPPPLRKRHIKTPVTTTSDPGTNKTADAGASERGEGAEGGDPSASEPSRGGEN